MNNVLYDVKHEVGLPAGTLGEGLPDVLYSGSRVLGWRIKEFIERLIETGSVVVSPDQSQSEQILLQYLSEPVAFPDSKDSKASDVKVEAEIKIEDLTVAQLRDLAAQVGVEIPRNANKATIMQLIEDKQAEIAKEKETANGSPVAPDANGVDLSDVSGFTQ